MMTERLPVCGGAKTPDTCASGAHGAGAVYTDHLAFLHLLRKVMLRVSTKLDWLILKLH